MKFDPESAQILRLEFARSNTKMTRPRQLFPATLAAATPIQHVLSPAAPAYIHPFTTREYLLSIVGNLLVAGCG